MEPTSAAPDAVPRADASFASATGEAERLQQGHLRLFTCWLLAWLVAYVAINAVTASVYGDLRIAICGVAFALVTLNLVRVLRRLDRVPVAQASIQVAGSLVVGSIVVLFAYPPVAGATALMPVTAVAMLLPHQASTRLRALMVMAGTTSVLQIVLGVFLPFSSRAPEWLVTFYVASGFAAGVVLVMVVLWQYQARWSRIVTTLSAANRRLDEQTAALTEEMAERMRLSDDRQKLASAVENSSDFVAIARVEGAIEFINPAGLRLVGLASLQDARKRRLSDLIPAEDGATFARVLDVVRTQGNWLGELRMQHLGTGERIPVELNAFRVEDTEGGKPIALAVVSRDITERKRSEEATRHLQAQFNQAQKMESVGRLAGGVAHDFNNLLTVINSYAELAQGDPDLKPEVREGLEIIFQAGVTAAELTRQLLAFSRRQVLQPKTVDLNTLVPEMNRMMRRLIGADITLTTRLAGDVWPVRVDPGQVQQVILNLAVNARDAMPDGGTLTVETANVWIDAETARRHPGLASGDHVMLAVSDTGTGMDEETQRRIFEPFFTTKGELGSGLGLATVYGIVQQSGGAIFVNSELGLGTTFKIYLPRQDEASAAQEMAPLHVERTGGETILVAEDSEGVRTLTTRVLRAAGYTVLSARDGEEAVRIAAEHDGTIHLLVTDVVMPGAGGREAAERIAAARPGMHVLFMSGYTEDRIITRQVLDAGIDFLEKPFTPISLAAKVAAILGARPRAS